jgi:hypothetical protein
LEVAYHHGGNLGKVYVPIAAGYVEPRTGGIAEVAITFSQAIDPSSITAGAVTLTSVKSGNLSALISGLPALDASGTRMVVVFTQALPDADTFTIAVGAGVKSLPGVAVGGTRSLCLSGAGRRCGTEPGCQRCGPAGRQGHIGEAVVPPMRSTT